MISMSLVIVVMIAIVVISIFIINENSADNIPKYIINLDRRQDRLAVTSRKLNKYGYNHVKRFRAIDGSKLTPPELKTLVDPDSLEPILAQIRTEHHQLSLGAVGCYLSHVELWKTIEHFAIIFEDDTNPSLSQGQLYDILKSAPPDWDIILIGAIYTTNQPSTLFDKVNRFICLHAYIINKKAIQKINPHLFPIKQQIDHLLSDLIQQDILNVYTIRDSNWMQNNEIGFTDIQTPMLENKPYFE